MQRRTAIIWRICATLVASGVADLCANAQQVNLLGGVIKNTHDDNLSGTCQAEYWIDQAQPFAAGLSYLNEGHFEMHHRDGLAGQLWLQHDVRKLTLAVGAGPYLYCDTKDDSEDVPYRNEHGVGALSSLMLKWPMTRRLKLQVRGNWIAARDMDTCSILVGIGGSFDSLFRKAGVAVQPMAPPAKHRNEITLFTGETIVNSFGSETTIPVSLEYRRQVRQHMQWTVSGLYEGCNSMIHRFGPATQLWVVDNLGDWPLTFGLGAGAYATMDQKGDDRETLAGIVSLTASYQFHPSYVARVNWHRILVDYDRDADVVLAGIGYLF